MSNIIWHTEKRRIGDLFEHPHNPRKLTGLQKDFLKESLSKFGLVEIPAINTDNMLLAGHQRTAILRALYGDDYQIEVRVPNRELTKEEADEYLIRSNKNTGDWDKDILAEYFTEEEMEAFGFTYDEIIDIKGFEYEELPEVEMQGFQYEETKYVKVLFDTPEEIKAFREKYGLSNQKRMVNYEKIKDKADVVRD